MGLLGCEGRESWAGLPGYLWSNDGHRFTRSAGALAETHATMRPSASPLSASNELLSGGPEIEAASGLEGFCKQPHHGCSHNRLQNRRVASRRPFPRRRRALAAVLLLLRRLLLSGRRGLVRLRCAAGRWHLEALPLLLRLTSRHDPPPRVAVDACTLHALPAEGSEPSAGRPAAPRDPIQDVWLSVLRRRDDRLGRGNRGIDSNTQTRWSA